MTEPRRVRTQVERDADGTTWRAPSFEDMLADPHRQFDPDDELLPHIIAFGTVRDDRPWLFNPAANTTAVPLKQPPADRSWIEMEPAPRRRWWHRYTRRNP